MNDTPGDPASIAVMIDMASEGPHAKALVNQRLNAREMCERLQETPQAKGFDLERAEFEALSGPNMMLSASCRLGEGIETRFRRRSRKEARHRIAIGDMRGGADRGRELTLRDRH